MTRDVLLLRPEELQGLVSMKEAIDIIEQGYQEALSYPAIAAPRCQRRSRVSASLAGVRPWSGLCWPPNRPRRLTSRSQGCSRGRA